MSKFRIFSIFIAAGLLVGAFGVSSVLARQVDRSSLDTLDASYAPAAVAISDNNIEWTDSDGTAISFVSASTTATFFINDDALETETPGNTITWSGATPSTDGATETFVISTGVVAGTAIALSASTTTVPRYTISAPQYASGTPASTPVSALSVAATDGSTSTEYGRSTSLSAGTGAFLVSGATNANATVTATFSHHVADSWDGQDSTLRRAKVISTSDPQGEYVTIGEVAAVGSSTASPTAQIFRGDAILSGDATTQGTADDGVWVQDGDTVTVNYLDSAGATIDSDTVTVDGVKPTISAVTPADGTVTKISNPTVQFDVTDTGSGIPTTSPSSAVTITINGIATPASSPPSFQAISGGFRVIFAYGNAWTLSETLGGFAVDDSIPFQWAITATDTAGNVQTLETTSLDLTIDQNEPTAVSAVTGTGWNTATALETTGDANAVKLVMSEDLDATSVAGADFTVGGVAASAAVVGTTTGNKNNVYLTTTAALSPDDKPAVVVAGAVSDLAANAVDTALTTATVTATDGLKPASTITLDRSLAVLDEIVKTTVVSDEKLTSTGGLVVSIQGPSASTGNGALTTTAATPLESEGSLTIASTVTTGMYGVSVQTTDTGANSATNLTAVAGEVPTIVDGTTTSVLTLAKGPVADADFSGTLDGSDVTVTVNGGGVAAGKITIDASARTLTVATTTALVDATVLASYSYPGNVFEVDQTAPTVTFDPVDATTVENQSPFIRAIFDDDEYPGDTHTAVTLSSASLLKPDATTEDVLSNFVVEADGVTHIWATSDLALGAYTLTVKGKDDAGNETAATASTFTIAERAKYSVSLRPGWNLVSLPGEPASGAIADVIDNLKVDQVVTYDPAVAGNWLTAIRDSANAWTGNLTTIDASHGYWIHTTTFDPIKVDIPALAPGTPSLPPAHAIVKGWNLVAVSVLNHATTAVNAVNYFSSISWARAYSYDGSASIPFTGIIPTETAEDVTVGKGYWVYATAAGTLVP